MAREILLLSIPHVYESTFIKYFFTYQGNKPRPVLNLLLESPVADPQLI